MILYSIGVSVLEGCYRMAGRWSPKARLWAEGRKGLVERIRSSVGKDDKIVWIHAASVGEFEQGRPLIEHVKATHPEYKILLTFYSPSGYELRKNYKNADYIFYFPSDKVRTVKAFLDAIHPEIAVIVKYEFWLNTLAELRRRGVRTFLISSVFRKDSIFFKFYGGAWRRALRTFETIFVQDELSKNLLERIGVCNVAVAGDTRFDRVYSITKTAPDVEIVEHFLDGRRAFVAGSTWAPDESLLLQLINDNPDVKFIIAPHEIDRERIRRFTSQVNGGAALYTSPSGDMTSPQVLVVDTVGLLSTIYKYASWAYVGGGFGVGIHNTVEPAAYGLPLAFGPNFRKFNEAKAMVSLGIAAVIRNYDDLSKWFVALKNDESLRTEKCNAAVSYTQSQLGATEKIINSIGL